MINNYKIIWSEKAKNELQYILDYINFKLKEPMVAKKLYQKLLNSLATIKYFSKGYSKLYFNNTIYRKLFINKHVIIFKISENTRTNFYLTYISRKSKLFKFIIKFILFLLSFSYNFF